MHYYRATIQYDGTDYSGFQWQKGARTVQADINQALQEISTGKFSTAGASRTDAGVHAVEQVLKFTTEHALDAATACERLNRALPSQIRCLDLLPCQGDFNPILGTRSKEYRYLFTNDTRVADEDRRFISNIANKLDLAPMAVCARMILGRHDFCNFVSTGSNVRTTIREVRVCELSEVDPHSLIPGSTLFRFPPTLGRCYQLKIEADGFLKQMIRHLVSALWLVGSGRLTPEQFAVLLNGPKVGKQMWKVAPPRGLYLYRIRYRDP